MSSKRSGRSDFSSRRMPSDSSLEDAVGLPALQQLEDLRVVQSEVVDVERDAREYGAARW